jgi:hypothetical protein
MDKNTVIKNLNAPTKQARLEALKLAKQLIDNGDIETKPQSVYTNNHVHTTYSFSPYSPSKTVYMARINGLATVGILDHDSISGAREFIEAGKIMDMPITIGFEMRTSFKGTSLESRRVNNPDQIGSAYISAHGIPHNKIDEADAFLKQVRDGRHERSKKMVINLNAIASKVDITIDYEKDILPLSQAADGGGVTERHILFAFTKALIAKYGKGKALADVFTDTFNLSLSASQMNYLLDEACDIYDYDVLNILKSGFVSQIYVDSTEEEMLPVKETVDFIKSIGGVASYCYLGDVGASPTGDKKAQKFEDDHLEEVLDLCKEIGFLAIAYMPSRNTPEQLARIIEMSEQRGFFQISGEDINQPRQSFICKQLTDDQYKHLIDTTWALIGHENIATQDLTKGMFYEDKDLTQQDLEQKIVEYMAIAKGE